MNEMQTNIAKSSPAFRIVSVTPEVDRGLLEAIDRVELSDRAARLKKRFLEAQAGIAGERTRLGMESWQASEGDPLDIRWAKMTRKWLDELPTPIFDDQRIVGNVTKYFRGVYAHPEIDGSYLAPLLTEKGKMTLGGPVEKGTVTEEDWNTLVEAAGFWAGKTPADLVRNTLHDMLGTQYGEDFLWYEGNVLNGQVREECGSGWAEVNGDCWDRLINEGLRGYVEQLQQKIADFKDDMEDDLEKVYFWQASLMCVEGIINFGRRYAAEARRQAESESDPARRAELLEIADICARVPENPARTFREGLQSAVMFHAALGVGNPLVPPFTWGRMDRYLYPLFKRDISEGRLTAEEAVDLMNDIFLYAARLEVHTSISYQDFQQKGVYSSLGTCGTDALGNDLSNELSYLILHSLGLSKVAGVNVVVGWHKDIPDWLMDKSIEAAWRTGGGMPQWQNTDHIVEKFVSHGVSVENARNWTSHGCSQVNSADSPLIMVNTIYNIPLYVDLALHNGVASHTGMRLGPETGDPRTFKTFDELYGAFQKQAEAYMRKQTWVARIVDRLRGYARQPLVSTFMSGCIENGQDANTGGAFSYVCNYAKDRGLVAAADSLTSIKKLVYEDKTITMDELLDALDHNYQVEEGEGETSQDYMRSNEYDSSKRETLQARRQEIKKLCLDAPKYGNDFGEPEEMLKQVSHFTGGIIESEKNIFGAPYIPIRNGQGWHWQAGKALGALPTGRGCCEALPDGSLSAMQGMDRHGPTALLNSALNADHREALAAILTPKLPASLMKTPELRHKLAVMTDAYMSGGGSYIQYNILDADTLRRAKKHPEQFRDLIVRVGGYSAYFTTLSSAIQDEIIARTEHTL